MGSHKQLYGELRCQLLSRHFALGRYWRANYFTNVENRLGTWPLAPDRDTTPRKFVCLRNMGGGKLGKCDDYCETPGKWGVDDNGNQIKIETYQKADDIIGNPALDIERWRVFRHNRLNSLMATSLRLVSLCIDHQLGDPHASYFIKVTMDTLQSLFKFAVTRDHDNPNYCGDDNFRGYILRWDPATSDNWSTVDKPPSSGDTPVSCCDFLLNSDPKSFRQGDHYLYCTPLNDYRYKRTRELTDNDKGFYRMWEPSTDEYMGLITAYSMLWYTYRDAPPPRPGRPPTLEWQIHEMVKNQANMVGRYLQYVDYILIRPTSGATGNGPVKGFTGNGAAGMNACLIYPFSRVLKRITDNDYLPQPPSAFDLFSRAILNPFLNPLEDSLRKAGVWDMWRNYRSDPRKLGADLHHAGDVVKPDIDKAIAYLKPLGVLDTIKQILGVNDWDGLTGIFKQQANSLSGANAKTAALMTFISAAEVILNPKCFDSCFHTDDSNCEGITQWILTAFLKPIADLNPKIPFQGWMKIQANSGDTPGGDKWKFWLGLTALGDSDTVVRDAFLDWYNPQLTQIKKIDNDESNGRGNPADHDEILGKENWCQEAFGTAVYNLIKPGDADTDAEKVVCHKLYQMRATLGSTYKNKLALEDGEDDDHTVYECDDKKGAPWFGYMATLSLAWLRQKIQNDAHPALNHINITDESNPTVSDIVGDRRNPGWRLPYVPGEVIKATLQNGWPVPINDIQMADATTHRHPGVYSGDMGLFDPDHLNTVPKPPDGACGNPPPPQPSVSIDIYIKSWDGPSPSDPLSFFTETMTKNNNRYPFPGPVLDLGEQLSDYSPNVIWANDMSRKNVHDGDFTYRFEGNVLVIDVTFDMWRWETDTKVVHTLAGDIPLTSPPYKKFLGIGEVRGGATITWTKDGIPSGH